MVAALVPPPGQLVSVLVSDPDIDTSEEEATAYVTSVNVGFLRFASSARTGG
jgi:hypothetical protein